MPTSDELTGLGLPPQLAATLGGNPLKLAGIGTAQTGAATLLTKNVELNPQAGATAYVLPATGVNQDFFLVNPQTTTALVFVPAGHTLSTVTSGGLNGHVSVAANTSVIIWQYKPKFWACNLSAVA